jgi:hypothetical protein
MRLFRDALCPSDELFTDAFPIKEIAEGAMYEVDAKYVSLSVENNFDIGANASADGQDESEPLEGGAKQVINLVHNCKLQETSYDKKSYMTSIKAYMGKVKELVQKNNPERVPAFQTAAQAWVKNILANFDEYSFYTGESMDNDAMVILCKFSEDGMSQKFYFWKDGLKEQKV